MLEVHFQSPLSQTAADRFVHVATDYRLDVSVAKKVLTFPVKADGKTEKRKGYRCE